MRSFSRISTGALIVACLTLSACGGWRDARGNPANWFGKSKEAPPPVEDTEIVNPLIPRDDDKVNFFGGPDDEVDLSVPVDSISEISIRPTPVGAIILATGQAKRLGAYSAHLAPDEAAEPGTLSYTLRVIYPSVGTPIGTSATRSISAAITLTHQELAGIDRVIVAAEENAQETRR